MEYKEIRKCNNCGQDKPVLIYMKNLTNNTYLFFCSDQCHMIFTKVSD